MKTPKLLPNFNHVYISELLGFLQTAEDNDKIDALLKEYHDLDTINRLVLLVITEVLHGPMPITFGLPPGSPPFQPAADLPGVSPKNFFSTHKRLKYLIKESPDFVKNPLKRESIFQQMLESQDGRESEFVIALVNRDKSLYKAFPEQSMRKLFPLPAKK